MDQHPIPQDVSGFQFKLIGAMTVKQFGYVAAGVIMAVVLYYLPLKGPLAILIKILLIPLFGGSGAFIAFVPIEGRPVDVMAMNFAKALLSPNQYVYRKKGRKFSFSSFTPPRHAAANADTKPETKITPNQAAANKKGQQLQTLLYSSQSASGNSLDQKELAFLNSLSAAYTAMPAPPSPVSPAIQQPQPVKNISQANIPFSGVKPVISDLPHVSDTPNVIVGIVRDPRGNVLPNILIEVKDSDGNPVRAFKTNVLGQFASATPLPNGTYTIVLEDMKKQHTFDKLQAILNGQILMPIEVASHDAREELRKALFN